MDKNPYIPAMPRIGIETCYRPRDARAKPPWAWILRQALSRAWFLCSSLSRASMPLSRALHQTVIEPFIMNDLEEICALSRAWWVFIEEWEARKERKQ